MCVYEKRRLALQSYLTFPARWPLALPPVGNLRCHAEGGAPRATGCRCLVALLSAGVSSRRPPVCKHIHHRCRPLGTSSTMGMPHPRGTSRLSAPTATAQAMQQASQQASRRRSPLRGASRCARLLLLQLRAPPQRPTTHAPASVPRRQLLRPTHFSPHHHRSTQVQVSLQRARAPTHTAPARPHRPTPATLSRYYRRGPGRRCCRRYRDFGDGAVYAWYQP